MVRFAAALGMCLVAGAAAAQRASTTGMTCGQARSFLAARGAAVIGTGGYTYDRFVRDRSFCQPTEVTRTAFVPTRDTPQCFIGYRCIEPSLDDWFGDD
ncbi:hypothetical protein [Enterovirga aerilata]|uniref:YARHG domain-containing protein n=1 Tax=Enterovirga aerilata TaxID=2730920 RepID=A0A849I196_9HYPH|nr:hypothetical protein [Enterovirga sp. DB1703]NNM73132.1 hypothetical protein [Enterovirga sp. DB1703]